jgi:hypothetical protein
MSPALEAFFAAEDLDDVLTARGSLAALTPEDEAAVRAVLNEWRNPQAVSNLLLHPALIPDDLRLSSLFRGLYEGPVAYYVLAAVVGLGGLDPAVLPDADRRRVLAVLLGIMRDTTDVLAQRASVSFDGFTLPEDAPRVFALMGHADRTVRHNLRAWLFRTFQGVGVEPLAVAGRASGAGEDMQRQVVGEFTEFVADPPQSFKSPLFLLYAYIPNLRDVEQPAGPGA